MDNIKKLFGSHTRVKLLSLFLNNPQKSYYVREITRAIDEQINSVRRELNNLEEIGVVEKFEKERKVYYQLGQETDLLRPLTLLFSDDELLGGSGGSVESESFDWFDEVAGIKANLASLVVMGSFLEDEDAEADMILVGDNSRNRISKWAQKMEKRLGRELRYVIFDQKDFEYRLMAKDVFLMHLLNMKHEVVFDDLNMIK